MVHHRVADSRVSGVSDMAIERYGRRASVASKGGLEDILAVVAESQGLPYSGIDAYDTSHAQRLNALLLKEDRQEARAWAKRRDAYVALQAKQRRRETRLAAYQYVRSFFSIASDLSVSRPATTLAPQTKLQQESFTNQATTIPSPNATKSVTIHAAPVQRVEEKPKLSLLSADSHDEAMTGQPILAVKTVAGLGDLGLQSAKSSQRQIERPLTAIVTIMSGVLVAAVVVGGGLYKMARQ